MVRLLAVMPNRPLSILWAKTLASAKVLICFVREIGLLWRFVQSVLGSIQILGSFPWEQRWINHLAGVDVWLESQVWSLGR